MLVAAVIQMPHVLSFPKDPQLLDGQSGLQVCWLLVWRSFWFSDSFIQDTFLSETGCEIVCRLLKIRVIIQVLKMTANQDPECSPAYKGSLRTWGDLCRIMEQQGRVELMSIT